MSELLDIQSCEINTFSNTQSLLGDFGLQVNSGNLLDILDITIEFMLTGGKILFPIVYEYDGEFIDLDQIQDFECFTGFGSLTLSDITQCGNGNLTVYKIKALRTYPGDDCVEFVLADAIKTIMDIDFTADNTYGSLPFTVQFINLSTPIKDIKYFFWDFGDGTFSTEESPEHTYMEEGEYTVVLYGYDYYTMARESLRKLFYIKIVKEEKRNLNSKHCYYFGIPPEYSKPKINSILSRLNEQTNTTKSR